MQNSRTFQWPGLQGRKWGAALGTQKGISGEPYIPNSQKCQRESGVSTGCAWSRASLSSSPTKDDDTGRKPQHWMRVRVQFAAEKASPNKALLPHAPCTSSLLYFISAWLLMVIRVRDLGHLHRHCTTSSTRKGSAWAW